MHHASTASLCTRQVAASSLSCNGGRRKEETKTVSHLYLDNIIIIIIWRVHTGNDTQLVAQLHEAIICQSLAGGISGPLCPTMEHCTYGGALRTG